MRDLEIFAQAIEIPDPEQRQQFVRTACEGDAALVERILRLLKSHGEAGNLLDSPAATSAILEKIRADAEQPLHGAISRDENPSFVAGTNRTIGPYRLLEKIGEGGFGEVFVAEQTEPVQRKVAIKIIKPELAKRPDFVERFVREATIASQLRHPYLVHTYEPGIDGETIYLPMELTLLVPIGAFVGWLYNRWAERQANPAFAERIGTLMATGLIVGESLMGVLFAAIVAGAERAGSTDSANVLAVIEEQWWAVPLGSRYDWSSTAAPTSTTTTSAPSCTRIDSDPRRRRTARSERPSPKRGCGRLSHHGRSAHRSVAT